MDQQMFQRMRGMSDLINETVDGTVNMVEDTHRALAGGTYMLLKQVGVIAAPVRLVEHIHMTITDHVYQSIRVVNRIAGDTATHICIAGLRNQEL